jgi:single-strand DNA-binding protein
MAGVNRVILIGNLGKDPEIRNLEGGVKKASFSLATSETYKGKNGEKVDQTEWHNIVLWRGLAEVAESYLKKGNTIFVEGKIKTRDYTDKDGNKRYITEIVADNMVMLGGKRDQPTGGESNGTYKQEKTSQPEPFEAPADLTAETGGDDLPF